MAPLPSLFALLCSIAVLLVRCDAKLKCKFGGVDKDDKMVQGTNDPTDVKDGMHYCMGANCINDKDKSNVFIWGAMADTDPNKCAATMKESVEGSGYGKGKWTCKCFFGEKDKDMDNQRFSKANGDVRLSLKTLMAMPPLLLGIVGPIVRANLIRPY